MFKECAIIATCPAIDIKFCIIIVDFIASRCSSPAIPASIVNVKIESRWITVEVESEYVEISRTEWDTNGSSHIARSRTRIIQTVHPRNTRIGSNIVIRHSVVKISTEPSVSLTREDDRIDNDQCS